MHVILPTGNMVTFLFHQSQSLLRTYGTIAPPREAFSDILQSYVEQTVFNRLKWTTKIDALDEALLRNLPWWNPELLPIEAEQNLQVKLCQEFYASLLDPLTLRIDEAVDYYVGQPNTDAMWTVWHTLRLGEDVALEKGCDYRIMEFNRCVANGSLPVSDEVRAEVLKGGGIF